jgi:phosphoribosyl 1,2-cyclic phosphate phosphodiesterase
MSDFYRFTILGCGSSGGVPRLGGIWGACDPANPKNNRTRCSMLVERIGEGGATRALIDTSPDMRQQLLRAGVASLDGVIYTHQHADHVHGLDDLRQVVFNRGGERLPVWADGGTINSLITRFGYAFVQPEHSAYPAILDLKPLEGHVVIGGAGGAILFQAIRVKHGNIDALGFRIGGLAYMPDVEEIYPESWAYLDKLDCWVLDALRYKPHPTHAHLARSLGWIERAGPRQAILTNMHIDLDYARLEAETPANVHPAYDGLVIELPLEHGP